MQWSFIFEKKGGFNINIMEKKYELIKLTFERIYAIINLKMGLSILYV